MWNTITALAEASSQHHEAAIPPQAGAAPAARIGQAVTQLRSAGGCSLSELARRSGLGKATLSRLEAGNHNATLDTLYAVANALGLPLVAILAAAGESRTSGAAIEALLVDSFATGGQTIETYRLTLHPRRRRSPAHVTGTVETLTLVTGEAFVGSTGHPRRLGAGQTATYAADIEHVYEAVGAAAIGVLVISTPR